MDKRPTAANSNARKFTKGILRLALATAAGGIEDAPRRRRVVRKLSRRPYRTRREIAAAVGAYAFKTVLDAIAAEGALERADHRVGCRWRQVYIATFAARTKFEHLDAFLSDRFLTSLSRYVTKRDVVHLLRLGGAGGQQEAEIGSGRDIARAHAHEFGSELRARSQPADADMLAMLATRGDGPGIGIAQAWMLVLAGKAPVGEKIIRSDHHQIDPFDRGDRVRLTQCFLAFTLDDEQRRLVESRIRRLGRKAPVMQMGQGPCRRAMPEWREFCRRDVGPRVIGRLHMRRDYAKRAGIE